MTYEIFAFYSSQHYRKNTILEDTKFINLLIPYSQKNAAFVPQSLVFLNTSPEKVVQSSLMLSL